MTTERPMLFSAPMIRALLAGTKSQTRRVVKDTGLYAIDAAIHGAETAARELQALASRCPYGQPGHKLWVRETHMDLGACYLYRADPGAETERALVAPAQPWKPAIHMPRAASRITLEVTGVRVERLQDITAADAIAEGIDADAQPGDAVPLWRNYSTGGTTVEPRFSYETLWNQINGQGAWELSPWVWVVEFKRVEVRHV
jgi:hypothetical protein